MSLETDFPTDDIEGEDFQVELAFARLPIGASGTVAATCRSWPNHWNDWPDGQIGGRPFWLVPSHLPHPSKLKCGNPKCGRTMALLVQLYAPVSKDMIGNNSAFHRMIYVFACTKAKCASVAGFQQNEKSFRVFRVQLPETNAFYPPNESREESEEESSICDYFGPTTLLAAEGRRKYDASEKVHKDDICILCGVAGPSRCARCKGPRYCSREHQSLHWKNGHKEACSASSSSYDASLLSSVARSEVTRASLLSGAILPCWELVVDAEPSKEERERIEEEKLPESVRERLVDIRAGKKGALDVEADGDGDATLIVPKGLKKNSIKKQFLDEGVERVKQDVEEVEEEGDVQLSFRGLTQKQLVTATGAAMFADPDLRYFQRRVACEPAQCIRYCLWPPLKPVSAESKAAVLANEVNNNPTSGDGGDIVNDDNDDDDDASDVENEPLGAPLWISSKNKLDGPIPPCENCGAPRLFEIQIMPQILSYVLQGLKATVSATGPAGIEGVDLDFGTLAIYTCSKSCIEKVKLEGGSESHDSPYLEEVLWVQPAGEDQLRVDNVEQAEAKEQNSTDKEDLSNIS